MKNTKINILLESSIHIFQSYYLQPISMINQFRKVFKNCDLTILYKCSHIRRKFQDFEY